MSSRKRRDRKMTIFMGMTLYSVQEMLDLNLQWTVHPTDANDRVSDHMAMSV
jgi:hypothetical protein